MSPLVEWRPAVVALDDGVFDVLCHVAGIDGNHLVTNGAVDEERLWPVVTRVSAGRLVFDVTNFVAQARLTAWTRALTTPFFDVNGLFDDFHVISLSNLQK